MSFDFGSLEKKPNTAKTSKPSVGTHKSVPSGKAEAQVPSFDFLNSGEEKKQATKPHTTTTQQAKPQPKPQAKPQEVKPHVEPLQVSKPHSTAPAKSTPATINLQTESKPVVKPVVSAGLESLSKPTPKPVHKVTPKPTVQPVSKPATQAKPVESSSTPSFNFGTPSSSSPQPFAKTPSKSTSKSTHSSHGSKDHRKGKQSNSPLDAIKNLDPMVLSAGIGGIVVLLVVIVCLCCMGGGEKAPASKPKNLWHEHCQKAYELTNQGEYQKAIAEYKKAFELDKNESSVPSQIVSIYRNNLHDESNAQHWESIRDNVQTAKMEELHGTGTKFHEERAAKKKAKQGKR